MHLTVFLQFIAARQRHAVLKTSDEVVGISLLKCDLIHQFYIIPDSSPRSQQSLHVLYNIKDLSLTIFVAIHSRTQLAIVGEFNEHEFGNVLKRWLQCFTACYNWPPDASAF